MVFSSGCLQSERRVCVCVCLLLPADWLPLCSIQEAGSGGACGSDLGCFHWPAAADRRSFVLRPLRLLIGPSPH